MIGNHAFSEDESHWRGGGYLNEEKVEVNTSYEYWSIKEKFHVFFFIY